MFKKKTLFSIFFILSLILTFLIVSPAPLQASDTAQFKAGMWWKMKINRVDNVYGEGKYQGTYKFTIEWSSKYEIVDVVGNEVRIRDSSTYSWRLESSGFFEQFFARTKKSGSGSYVEEWTVDRSTGKVLVAPSDEEEEENRLYDGLINPKMAYLGAEIPRRWFDLNGEYVEKQFKVSEAEIEMKGFTLKVWDVYYSGESAGLWGLLWYLVKPTSGYETEHLYYDKALGVVVGAKLEGEAEYKMGANYISQKATIEWKFVDSNMWHVVSFDVEPRVVGLTIDGNDYPKDSLPKSFLYTSGTSHMVKAPAELVEGDVKYVFKRWSNGDETNEITIIPEKDESYKAEYITQYRLIVKSEHGQPKGSGWYNSGTTATFSIQPEAPLEGFLGFIGVKYVFDHWSGDSNATTPEATILMNSPKTIEAIWKINYTPLYILVPILTILIIAIVFAISKLRAKRAVPSSTIRKCPRCGAEVPPDANYCLECGERIT